MARQVNLGVKGEKATKGCEKTARYGRGKTIPNEKVGRRPRVTKGREKRLVGAPVREVRNKNHQAPTLSGADHRQLEQKPNLWRIEVAFEAWGVGKYFQVPGGENQANPQKGDEPRILL